MNGDSYANESGGSSIGGSLSRSRSLSLPLNSPSKKFNEVDQLTDLLDQTFAISEDEADDERSVNNDDHTPKQTAKREIAHARKLSKNLISQHTTHNSTESLDHNRPNRSLVGSIYSLGGAVWNFIRGPVETDSNDELSINSGNRRLRNKNKNGSNSGSGSSFFFNRQKEEEESESNESEASSSDAPNFDFYPSSRDSNSTTTTTKTKSFVTPTLSLDQVINNPNPATISSISANSMKSYSEKRLIAEPGRGREIMSNKNVESCNLMGRDFPADEHLLSNKDISIIASGIPSRWRIHSNWTLLYSTRGNGFSLTTLYTQISQFKGPLIIAVKDETAKVFGAFTNQSLCPRVGHYGTGESFLWRKSTDNSHSSSFIKYPSTGKNNYFIITENGYLAVGCGGGKFGLWLDHELFKGTSDPVPTFDNEQLSHSQQFDCNAIEIWGLNVDE